MRDIQISIIPLQDRVEKAIETLKAFEPEDGYYLAYSGGKDSVVCKKLCEMAKVRFDAHYNCTSVDPPELVRFIKTHPWNVDVEWHSPEMPMRALIVKKTMPPTRMVRYCCDVLKEGGGEGRTVITGVRWAESSNRAATRMEVEFDSYGSQSKKAIEQREKFYLIEENSEKRRMMEICVTKGKNIVNPIVAWSDSEVWDFIQTYDVPYCDLYDQGWDRLGCVGCPMAGKKREFEFARYPKMKRYYIKAFDEMIKERKRREMETEWETGEDVFAWWMSR